MTPERLIKCRHGVDVSLRFETRIDGDKFVTVVRQNICSACTAESIETALNQQSAQEKS